MKPTRKILLAAMLASLIATLGAFLYTRDWSEYSERLQLIENNEGTKQLVDMHPLDTARELAPLAATRTEQDYVQQALRLGDHAVDLAFDAAMRDATENPAPLTAETRELVSRVKKAQTALAADQARVEQLTQQLAKAGPAEKGDVQQDLGIAQAQLSLDEDELEDAHQDLIRMGGDKQAIIQQLIDQHQASEVHSANAASSTASNAAAAAPSAAAANSAESIETSTRENLVAQARAWWSLRSKEKLLVQARNDALARMDKLTESHEALEKEIDQEKARKTILRKGAGADAPNPTTAPSDATQSGVPPTEANSPKSSILSFIRHLTQDQKSLSEFDKRIEFEKQLAAVYANWIGYTAQREKAFLHGIILGVFWILFIGALVLLITHSAERISAGASGDRRRALTVRAVVILSAQLLGALLILVVIFGTPTNLATVIALAGAGLTVTMKDFIVGFFGWFVLMGRNGIHPGDWVEINGVGGEVISVGLLHTILMETGSWSEAGYSTGRKASFVNSFAIEGHYFNFSTSGQWLWDQIEVQIPANVEPYRTAEAIQKIAADATVANAHLAEEEWNRVTPSYAKHSFSATPSMSIRPEGAGVKVLVRYITRVNDRHEVRARIYRAVVDLLHKDQIPDLPSKVSVSQAVGDRS